MVYALKDVNFTEEQRKLLAEIHRLARQMETINNERPAHYIIAMIEELSAGVVSEIYMNEKLKELMSY